MHPSFRNTRAISVSGVESRPVCITQISETHQEDNAASSRTNRQEMTCVFSPYRAGAAYLPFRDTDIPARAWHVFNSALDDLVEFSTIKPHTPAVGTIVDFYPMALTDYEGFITIRAYHMMVFLCQFRESIKKRFRQTPEPLLCLGINAILL